MHQIRIATRQSPLALWQAHHVGQRLLKTWPGLEYVLVPYVTSGDKFLKQPLQTLGGKGLFVKELEEAILRDEADIAVHSMKDMPATLPAGLCIQTILRRADPSDAFLSLRYSSYQNLPSNAVIGTTSLRRQSQLLAFNPALTIKMLRGNINTRIAKLEQGEFDAIILATAGLERMGFTQHLKEKFPFDTMVPACAQGALGIECRENDDKIQAIIQPLNDEITSDCVRIEREVSAALGGSCQLPLGVHCAVEEQGLQLQVRLLKPDGSYFIEEKQALPWEATAKLAPVVLEQLFKKGAQDLLV